VLGERPAGTGQVAAALEPRVQLVEDGAADFPHLQVPEGGLDGAADESFVGLPRGHVPLCDRCVLVEQLRDGGVGLGRAAFGSFLQQPAELNVGLLLRLGGGLEADRAPGERVGPGVHGNPERPARQLLYVAFGNSGHGSRVTPTEDIRPTTRPTEVIVMRAYPL